jgi:uncharacterized iron-regulated protein
MSDPGLNNGFMVSALILMTVLAQSMSSAAARAQGDPQRAPLPAAHPPVAAVYVPERVFDTRRKAFTDFETMLADLARADVVLIGEQHDDSNTHRLEAAVLQGLMRRHVPVIVSLEMFERDVQPQLDAYLAGSMNEEEFLQKSRPWPRYATDYRPLVEMARAHGWKVVAANVPRPLAADVSKAGQPALEKLQPAERAMGALDLQCPLDGYYTRFAETMGSHAGTGNTGASGEEQRATIERYYLAQCLKDETMAESIAGAFDRQAARPGTIVHYTGSFHTDFGTGTAERVQRRLPGRRIALVSMLPVDDLDTLAPEEEDLKRAEYLVYTIK